MFEDEICAFISYCQKSSLSNEYAQWLSLQLKKDITIPNVQPCWLDTSNTVGGKIQVELFYALSRTRVLVVLVSVEALCSDCVWREVRHFTETHPDRTVFPMLMMPLQRLQHMVRTMPTELRERRVVFEPLTGLSPIKIEQQIYHPAYCMTLLRCAYTRLLAAVMGYAIQMPKPNDVSESPRFQLLAELLHRELDKPGRQGRPLWISAVSPERAEAFLNDVMQNGKKLYRETEGSYEYSPTRKDHRLCLQVVRSEPNLSSSIPSHTGAELYIHRIGIDNSDGVPFIDRFNLDERAQGWLTELVTQCQVDGADTLPVDKSRKLLPDLVQAVEYLEENDSTYKVESRGLLWIFIRLAEAWLSLGRVDKCLIIISAAPKSDGRNTLRSMLGRLKGLALNEEKRFTAAISALEEALQFAESAWDRISILTAQGRIFLSAGKPRQARRALSTALSLSNVEGAAKKGVGGNALAEAGLSATLCKLEAEIYLEWLKLLERQPCEIQKLRIRVDDLRKNGAGRSGRFEDLESKLSYMEGQSALIDRSPAEAEHKFGACLKWREKLYPSPHPELADGQRELARALFERPSPLEHVRACLNGALQQIGYQLGLEDVLIEPIPSSQQQLQLWQRARIGDFLSITGYALLRSEQPKGARAILNKANEALIQNGMKNHPDRLLVLASLANIARVEGQYLTFISYFWQMIVLYFILRFEPPCQPQ